MKKIWKFYLPPVLWAGLIFWNSSRPNVNIPKLGFQNVDKIAHFGVYFILGYLIVRAITAEKTLKIGWKKNLLILLIGVLYAASDEFHQLFVPGRSADLADWIADLVGVILGHLAFIRLQRQLRKSEFTRDSASDAKMEGKSRQ